MEMIFHSHANKTHFHKKGCALLKVRNFGTRKWPIRFEYGYMWKSGNKKLRIQKYLDTCGRGLRFFIYSVQLYVTKVSATSSFFGENADLKHFHLTSFYKSAHLGENGEVDNNL